MPGSVACYHAVKFAGWYLALFRGLTLSLQANQGRNAQPPQQSFDSWADVSPNPVQPLVVMPSGTLDTA